MNPLMNPQEAAQSLADIRRTQAKAVGSQPWFPTWYMVGVGLFVTGAQLVTEPGTPAVVMAAGGGVLAVGLGALIARLVTSRRMTAHRSVLSAAGMAGFALWLALSIGPALALALWMSTREVAYARTYAALGMSAFMALTGPYVARWISRQMAMKIEKGV
ncbi:hypothetical protein N5079_20365 [Planotetraspora sp. A-T 1434]|uniref:hypothetical protein n=1 Tax=Planotetraspora sp. A-T 1434 TaxID=2979219 RepID=UPI0021C2445B|nr:hypothetical protein [Planotetraspora sp. A-T 1434]MCT9932558.1 hypothetical protein [Planotetraspora sp. A-T 1434]